jgi:hypothetical protein
MKVQQPRPGQGVGGAASPAGYTGHRVALVPDALGCRRGCRHFGVGINPDLRADQVAFVFRARGPQLRDNDGVLGAKRMSVIDRGLAVFHIFLLFDNSLLMVITIDARAYGK